MSLYSDAVAVVRTAVETRLAELDAISRTLRDECVTEMRCMATRGVDPGSPAYAICALVAHTLTVGDGPMTFPYVWIPDDTRRVIAAAREAGVLTSSDDQCAIVGALMFKTNDNTPANCTSSSAWRAARDHYGEATCYRDRQRLGTLD